MTHKIYTAIGLMSGTSLDGVDVALIRTDGQDIVETEKFESFPYEESERKVIRAAFGRRAHSDIVEAASKIVTHAHIHALSRFGEKADIIGFHGQTITHDPARHFTWQIGDAHAVARAIKTDVVADFRTADVRAGGQGAPLIPLYHRAMTARCQKPVAVVNIGGVANVTYIGADGDVMAFDTGPGNALIDDYVLACTGRDYDHDGEIAHSGMVRDDILQACLRHPYFKKPVPKSLDRNTFHDIHLDLRSDTSSLNAEDAVATLTAFTAWSIALARACFPAAPESWYVTGGGRHNKTMMRFLSEALGAPVRPVEDIGHNGDAVEAEGFAYLAVRSRLGLPLSLPSTTGVASPLTGGVLFRP
jgi:anhydro-N-acetylmuramic acid kinase